MGENSGIEWTDHTFNPWVGCTKVSLACDHCYAETWDKRAGGAHWGPHADRRRTKTWGSPVKWNRRAVKEGRRDRVFCASLADVFDNHRSILPEWRDDLWALIRETPHLDWLLLTKRPQNIERYLPPDWGSGYRNVWLGATVEDQAEAERRIPPLLTVPARVHFLSCEPMLGPVDLSRWRYCREPLHRIDWVICGGESGPGSRPMLPEWARDLRNQCVSAKVPFHFKQWGDHNHYARRVGKKRAGRVLDGRTWDQAPPPPQDQAEKEAG